MAALGALVKKVWSIRRFLVLLCTPLVLLPILFSLPPKVTQLARRRSPLARMGQSINQSINQQLVQRRFFLPALAPASSLAAS